MANKLPIFFSEATHGNPIKTWLPVVPVHFVTVSGKTNVIDEITIVTKATIFDCTTLGVNHIHLPENWAVASEKWCAEMKNIAQQHQPNGYALFVFPVPKDGKVAPQSPTHLLKMFLNMTFHENFQTVCCIDYLTFYEFIFDLSNIPFDRESVIKQHQSIHLHQQLQPCEHHQADPKQCGTEKCSLFSAAFQYVLISKRIALFNKQNLLDVRENQLTSNHTYLYVDMVEEEGEIVEIGYVVFKQSEKEHDGEYRLVKDPQVFQCSPKTKKPELGYFFDKYPLTEVMAYIITKLKEEPHDYLIFATKELKNLTFKFAPEMKQQKNIVAREEFLKQLYCSRHQVPFGQMMKEITAMRKVLVETINMQRGFVCEYHRQTCRQKCSVTMCYLFVSEINYFRCNPYQPSTPNTKTIIYIDSASHRDKIIEVGYSIITYSTLMDKNQYQLTDYQGFYTKPQVSSDSLEEFDEKTNFSQVINTIFYNILLLKQFDYIVFGNKGIQNVFMKRQGKSHLKFQAFISYLQNVVEEKMELPNVDVIKQIQYVTEHMQKEDIMPCPYHHENPTEECIYHKIKKIVTKMNYFNDHMEEIHEHIPFEEMTTGPKKGGKKATTKKMTKKVEPVASVPHPLTEHKGLECCICAAHSKEVVATLCGHILCKECSTEWFGGMNQTRCPMCNTPVPDGKVTQLFI